MKETWYQCEIKGQTEPVYIANYAVKDMADFDQEIIFNDVEGKINSKDGSETRTTIYEGDKIKVDTKNIANGVCPVYFEGEDRCPTGYMDIASLGLDENVQVIENDKIQDKKEDGLIQVQEQGNNKLTYVMDFGHFDNYEGFIETMNDLIEKDMLSGVMFRIGATSQFDINDDGTPIGFRIVSFVDDPEEYAMPEQDTILLEGGYKEIKEKSKEHGEEVKFTGGLGSIKEFEKFIRAVNDAGIAWGYYYYQGSADPNRSSAEAAYIYNVMEKIKSDLGAEYTNSKKLPFMFDIEDTQTKVNKDKERIDAVKNEQRLLGHGVDSNEYWAIKNVDPKKGYNLSADYNDQFMVYSAIIPTCEITSDSLMKMEEELSEEGYTMIYNSTRKINNKKTYEEITQIPELRDYTKDSLEEYKSNYKSYDQNLCDRSDLVQTFLDVEALKGKPIDLSLTSKDTVNRIVAGTYKHEKTYFEKLDDAVNENNYTTEMDSTNIYEEQTEGEETYSSETETSSIDETETKMETYKETGNETKAETNTRVEEEDLDR